MRDCDFALWLLFFIGVGLVGGVGFVVYEHFYSWPAYVAENSCGKTGESRERTIQTCQMIGKVMICNPQQVTDEQWYCQSNGESVWR